VVGVSWDMHSVLWGGCRIWEGKLGEGIRVIVTCIREAQISQLLSENLEYHVLVLFAILRFLFQDFEGLPFSSKNSSR
jgi:hypothetical protein